MLSAMRKYDACKDSGVGWIGEIPEHWELNKLKYIFTEKKHKQNFRLNSGAISFGKVVKKDDEKITKTTKASYQEVLDGEFLINPLNLNYDLVSLRVALSRINVVVSAGYIVLKEISNIEKEYFKYLLHRYDVAYMKLLGSGVRQTISFNHIANSILIIPPTQEQQAIANYLDDKTAKIDQAISIKAKQITLLKERKQIMIQNAVTRGLNPDVAMRDSGVEWLREIPEHWEIMRLKFLVKIRYGLGQPPRELDLGLPIIRATNIERGKITNNEIVYVDPSDIPWDRNPVLKKNDIIVVRSGAYTGDSAIVTKDYEGSIAGYDMVMTPFLINPKFIAFSMLAHYVLYDQLYLLRIRSAQPHLNAEELGETVIVFPSQKEQQAIVAHIEAESTKIDQAINIQQQQIEKLKEYRSTLINSAVTGKIKVA